MKRFLFALMKRFLFALMSLFLVSFAFAGGQTDAAVASAMTKITAVLDQATGMVPEVAKQMTANGILGHQVAVFLGWGLFLLGGASLWLGFYLWERDKTSKRNLADGAIVLWVVGGIVLFISISTLISSYVNVWRWTNIPEFMIVKELLRR